jgi:hypothetical protein
VFGTNQLADLQRRKEQLVARSEANRQRLRAEWRQLKSLASWRDEGLAGGWRRPLWAVALLLGAGLLAGKVARRPGAWIRGVSAITRFIPAALTVWRLFRRKRSSS